MTRMTRMTVFAAIGVIASCAHGVTPAAPHDDDDRFVMPAEVEIGTLVVDDARFATLAHAVRARFERELAAPIANPAREKSRRFLLSILDALDDRWTDAIAELDRVRALEPSLALRAMTGLTIRVWADARAHDGDSPDAFRAALERTVATLPVADVRDQLGELRAMGEAFTPEVCRQLVAESVHPDHGTIGVDDLDAIIFQRYAVVRLVPVGAIIADVLRAHDIALPPQ